MMNQCDYSAAAQYRQGSAVKARYLLHESTSSVKIALHFHNRQEQPAEVVA